MRVIATSSTYAKLKSKFEEHRPLSKQERFKSSLQLAKHIETLNHAQLTKTIWFVRGTAFVTAGFAICWMIAHGMHQLSAISVGIPMGCITAIVVFVFLSFFSSTSEISEARHESLLLNSLNEAQKVYVEKFILRNHDAAHLVASWGGVAELTNREYNMLMDLHDTHAETTGRFYLPPAARTSLRAN